MRENRVLVTKLRPHLAVTKLHRLWSISQWKFQHQVVSMGQHFLQVDFVWQLCIKLILLMSYRLTTISIQVQLAWHPSRILLRTYSFYVYVVLCSIVLCVYIKKKVRVTWWLIYTVQSVWHHRIILQDLNSKSDNHISCQAAQIQWPYGSYGAQSQEEIWERKLQEEIRRQNDQSNFLSQTSPAAPDA